MKIGVVLGKFMPLHLGHEFLINTAIRKCDMLYIFVCSLSKEPIDGRLRFEWMQERFRESAFKIIHIDEDWIPQEPSGCHHREAFYGTWSGIIKAYVKEDIDYFFASEDYVYPMAHFLGAEPVLVDVNRETYPVSGTLARTKPIEYWEYMNKNVRKYFTKKVLVIGGESTGKSTLTADLEKHFNDNGVSAVGVQEYAREWIDRHLGGDMNLLTSKHIDMFGSTQNYLIDRTIKHDDVQLVISDTDAIVSSVFQVMYFGELSDKLKTEMINEEWDLVLFLQPDVEWVDDGQRNLSDRREAVNNMIRNKLRLLGIDYIQIRGNWEERFNRSVKSINEMLWSE